MENTMTLHNATPQEICDYYNLRPNLTLVELANRSGKNIFELTRILEEGIPIRRLYWCNVTYQTPSGKYQSIRTVRRGLVGKETCAELRYTIERFPGLRKIARWTPERDVPPVYIEEGGS